MAYFLPSFFQKRLLRYALSRLELVDTEALDLDSLGIRWGQRSTVELRDVGLKLEKLATLLHLPPSSELLSARVQYLQITVPADIYSSGIICEARGIDVHLRLLSDDACQTDGNGKQRPKAPHQSTIHDPGGDQILPTPTHLAASFLESEPKAEKEELQAAISSRSQVLQRSSTSSSDDEEELGLGSENMSLPSFVAGFLKGVADRLQVKINGISIRVDMELKQDGTSKRRPEDKPDLVTGLFSVGEVCVDAVSRSSGEDETLPRKDGKRLVSLSDIHAALISDPVVFSNYSRFAVAVSPSPTTQSKEDQPSSRAPSPPPAASSDSSSVLAMTRSTIFQPPPDNVMTSSVHQQMEGSTYTSDGRFSDADTEAEYRSDGSSDGPPNLSDSQYNDGILDNPAYLDSAIDSQFDDDDVEGSATLPSKEQEQERQSPSSDDTPHPRTAQMHASRSPAEDRDMEKSGTLEPSVSQDHRKHSFRSNKPSLQTGEQGDSSHNETWLLSSGQIGRLEHEGKHRQHSLHSSEVDPGTGQHGGSSNNEAWLLSSGQIARREHEGSQREHVSSSGYPPSESSSTGSQSGSSTGELSESRLFSHEQAQSMYMSAISHASASESFMPDIPGAWDSPRSTGTIRDYGRHSPETDHRVSVSEGQDETTVSTPKLTAQSGKFVPDDRVLDSQLQAQPETVEETSAPPSPALNKLTDVAKRFFEIDKILIWLPSTDHNAEKPEPHPAMQHKRSESSDLRESIMRMRDSTANDDMLTSRIYAFSRFRRDSVESESPPEDGTSNAPRRSDEKTLHPDFTDESHGIAVEVASIAVQFDTATGWLLTKVGQQILRAFDGSGEESTGKKQPSAEKQARLGLGLAVSNLSVKFVEHLPGYTYPVTGSRLHSSPSYLGVEDVVLRLTASGLKTRLLTDSNMTTFRLNVSRFAFGFASGDLLSFDEGLKMRESTRDILSPVHGDISLSLRKSADAAEVNVTTLPIQLNLNIQRLEEVVNWIGGLSTILELGSSISSVSTVRGAKTEPPRRPRGVHFEAVPPVETSRSPSIPWKVNARIGGIVLDIIGDTHHLKLKTTAVKVVSRFEGIGVQIDKAKLSGPIPLDDAQDGPAKITLVNIRVEYLFAPKEIDLDRLLALITPSKDKYDEDDDIMLDTLFRQRRQGAVLRTTVAGMKLVVTRIRDLDSLAQLGNELSRLSTVTKYLPEDDRPGILLLTLIRELEGQVHVGGGVGDLNLFMRDTEAAYISIPSLTAARVGSISVTRNEVEELVGEALPLSEQKESTQAHLPMLMARFIADEMDPTFKIKLYNLRAEYTIPSLIAFLGMSEDMTTGDVAANMANSLANLADMHAYQQDTAQMPEQYPRKPESPKPTDTPTRLAVVLRDCVLGLNPRDIAAKALVVLTNAKFSGAIHDHETSEATLDLRKATVMVIDDVQNVGRTDNLHRRSSSVTQSNQVQTLIDMGYVPVSYVSSAMAVVKLVSLSEDGTKSIDVELRDDLLILETCADSTQTLISILNGLQPPVPPSTSLKYRTEVMPIQDMLASFSGNAFATDSLPDSEHMPSPAAEGARAQGAVDLDDELEYVSDFYPQKLGSDGDPLSTSMTASVIAASDSHDLLDSFHSQYHVSSSISELEFQDDHFGKQSAVGGTAHRWDSTYNTYGLSNDAKLQKSPLRVRVRDVHVIWNLFDGYDWQRTRDTISKAVKDVEMKATERRARIGSRLSPGLEDDEESVIGDFLFNSIYIGIPANKDPRELNQDINRNIDDLVSETGSYATSTTVTGATSRPGHPPSLRGKKLRLSRSKHHKMTFELKGICADLVVFPPGSGETQSSLDVRIKDLEIFDHVPTSTWKKFATYMHEVGEKESGTSMVHLEILTVKPVAELAASEIILKATVLPLRLHVDQDALDFMSRFFEFRDESAPAPNSPGDVPFLQRVEVNAVQVKLDFKPKRVDYAGLRSGRTTEFMNFFVLDGADMVLRHVIIYGVSGFDKLGQTLNDIWMPDVKSNQLPGVLAGLAPIRSLVNVGGGVKDLVVIPMREYRKDGRIVRSIQKGAMAFAKTTTNELVKLGAKLAIGTQTVLQGAEGLLNAPAGQLAGMEEDLMDEEETKKISLYADQPVGVVQGLRGAFSSLERDLLMARDAIVAVPGEVVESGSAKAAARAVWKRAPTVILRPAIGVSKAVGQTLLGAGNTLDPSNRRKMEDKYKRH